jgi:hypothetical protein
MGDIRELNPIYRIGNQNFNVISAKKHKPDKDAPNKDPQGQGDEVILELDIEESEHLVEEPQNLEVQVDPTHLDISA